MKELEEEHSSRVEEIQVRKELLEKHNRDVLEFQTIDDEIRDCGRRMTENGFDMIKTSSTFKQFLICIFKIILDRMIKENVYHFEHSYSDYSIRVNLKQIIKVDPEQKPKPKRNELIPLYGPKKYITPN